MKKNWLRNCDFLNIPMSLSYRNDIFYATYVGAFLTIFGFIIISVISFYEIKELYSKSSFTIISNQYTELSQKLDFAKTPILFQLTNSKGKVIERDEKLFEFKAIDIESYTSPTNSSRKKLINTPLELVTCDKVYRNDIDYLSHLNLSRYICIKPGQNLTAYGLLGDSNNGFKGFRIYINRCSGSDCYDSSKINSKFKNAKFVVTYLSLETNIYSLDGNHLKYQLFSQTLSLSTNLLKKFIFTFNIGRFFLYNNIVFKKRTQFDFITLNSQLIDVDLDPTSTLSNDEDTIAYISFHYSGNVIEISKEVQRLFDTIAIIGNTFNIVLTVFKIINNYYSNKVLFVDIFRNIFFSKDIHFNIRDNNVNIIHPFKNCQNFTINKKHYLDKSDEIDFNNDNNNNNCNLNKINVLQKSNKNSNKIIPNEKEYEFDKNNNKISHHKKKSHQFKINEECKFFHKKIVYYYFIPYCILKKIRTFNAIGLIKDKICSYFSIEKISELIKFKENMEIMEKEKKNKMNNTELLRINNTKFDNNSSNKKIK
jgi:hypothetical protein